MNNSAIEDIAGLIINIAFITRTGFEETKEDVDKIVDALIGVCYDEEVGRRIKKYVEKNLSDQGYEH